MATQQQIDAGFNAFCAAGDMGLSLYQQIAEAIKASEQAAWQDISTAPKDKKISFLAHFKGRFFYDFDCDYGSTEIYLNELSKVIFCPKDPKDGSDEEAFISDCGHVFSLNGYEINGKKNYDNEEDMKADDYLRIVCWRPFDAPTDINEKDLK